MPSKQRKPGFTLIEILIALAITGVLMAAVASAFNASLMNYQENQTLFAAMNKARQAMTRITTEMRNCDWVHTVSTNQCKIEFFAGNNFYPANTNVKVLYEFDSSTKTLLLKRWIDDVENPVGYVTLCPEVEDVSFSGSQNTSGEYNSVRISFHGVGCNATQDLASAVVIRRRLEN